MKSKILYVIMFTYYNLNIVLNLIIPLEAVLRFVFSFAIFSLVLGEKNIERMNIEIKS